MQLSKAKMWILRFLLMNWHLRWMASSPWGANLLFCGRKSTCSWWKAGKIPLGQLKSTYLCHIERFTLGRLKNASLVVDDLAGQLLLRKPTAAPCQELRVALLAYPFHSLVPSAFPWCSPAVGYLSHRRQPLTHIITVFVYKAGSACFAEQKSMQKLHVLSVRVFNNPCPSCCSSSLALPHSALVLSNLLQPSSFVAALTLTDTMTKQ